MKETETDPQHVDMIYTNDKEHLDAIVRRLIKLEQIFHVRVFPDGHTKGCVELALVHPFRQSQRRVYEEYARELDTVQVNEDEVLYTVTVYEPSRAALNYLNKYLFLTYKFDLLRG